MLLKICLLLILFVPNILFSSDLSYQQRGETLRRAEALRSRNPYEAEKLLNTIILRDFPIVGFADDITATAIDEIGKIYYNRQQYQVAENYFRESLNLFIRIHGPEHLASAYVMGDLGAALREQGKLKEAYDIVEKSVEIRRLLLPADDPTLITGIDNLKRIYMALDKKDDAEKLFYEVWNIYWLKTTQALFLFWLPTFIALLIIQTWKEGRLHKQLPLKSWINISEIILKVLYYIASGIFGSFIFLKFGISYIKMYNLDKHTIGQITKLLFLLAALLFAYIFNIQMALWRYLLKLPQKKVTIFKN